MYTQEDDMPCIGCEYYVAEEDRCGAFECNGLDCEPLPCECKSEEKQV